MRIIHCHNIQHLGDCIQTLHFLLNTSKYNDVYFRFACNPKYHNQLQDFMYGYDKVKLTSEIYSSSIDTWIGAHDYGKLCKQSDEIYKDTSDQGTYFLLLWKKLSKIMEVECPFQTKQDMVYNEKGLSFDPSIKNQYDYLFINSQNMSIPFPNFENECSGIIEKLNESNNSFITTRKIENYPCTLDHNLNVVDIARLAKNVKNIIAVNTGPLHLCMNKWVIPRISKFIIWSPTPENFNYGPNFINVKSLKEIEQL